MTPYLLSLSLLLLILIGKAIKAGRGDGEWEQFD
jgi:hypothetical protein